MVLSLVYVSSATHLMDQEELLRILEDSRRHNSEVGVTGMLLYHDGNLMQALEGDEAAVGEVYERIARDPRHTGLITLIREHQPERSFGEWSMAFRDLNAEPDAVAGYSDFLKTGLRADRLAGNPGLADVLLRTFRQTIR